MNIQKTTQFISFKKAFFIALLIFSFSIIFVDSAKAADWKKTPAQCPSVYEGYGQTGGPGEGMCGVLGNTALWFSTSSLVLLVPTSSTSTNNTPGQSLGGYVVDCHAYDASPLPDGPFCDNNTNFWCSPDPSCNNLYVKTTCNASKWASDSSAFTCVTPGAAPSTTGCISGYANCNIGTSDPNNCEVRIGVTTCTGAGGLQGTLNASCECIVPASNFRTGIQAEFLTSSPLLWGKQYGDGDLIRFTNNAVATSSFVVFNSGQVAIGHNINVSTTSVAFEVSSTQRGILIPRLGGNPANGIDGELYYDSVAKKFKYFNGDTMTWGELGGGLPSGSIGQILVNNGGENWVTSSVFRVVTNKYGIAMNDNVVAGNYSAVLGNGNITTGTFSFIAGGYQNKINSGSEASTIGGGVYNTILGSKSFIANGGSNNISGDFSFIGSAEGSSILGDYSTIFGRNMTINGNDSFGVSLSNTYYTITNSNTMAIMGGNVGIGTTSPSGILHTVSPGFSTVPIFERSASGNSKYTALKVSARRNVSSADGMGPGIDFISIINSSVDPYGNISSNSSSTVASIAGLLNGSSSSTGRLAFYTNNEGSLTEKMTIDNNGNVGIGTTSPYKKLHLVTEDQYDFFISRNLDQPGITMGMSSDIGGNWNGNMSIYGYGDYGPGSETIYFQGLGGLGYFDGGVTAGTSSYVSLNNDGSILAKGIYGSGWDGGNMGAGTRLMWIPEKSAFRVGNVEGTEWDTANIGNYSHAIGTNNKASGTFSTAIGGGYNNASGYFGSIISGYKNVADGGYSFIGGGEYNTTTGGNSFIGAGRYNQATGVYSFIGAGRYNQATGEGATTFGYGNKAGGNYSVALGKYSTTTFNAAYSFAGGEQSMVQSGGFLGLAVSNNSFAYGYKAIAGGVTSFAFGENAIAGFKEDPLFGYHNFWSHAVAIGREAVSRGTASYALGWNSFVDQDNIFSYAIGAGATVSSSNTSSFAIGDNAKIGSNAEYSFALGKYYTNSTANSLGISFNTTQSSNPALHIKGSGTSNTRIGIGAINSGSYITLIDSGSTSNLALDVRGSTQIRGTFFLPNINSGAGSAYLCRASGGEVYYSTTACNPSDERLKDVETEINTQLDVFSALDKIRGVYYYWNTSTYGENDGKRQIGVIAQEIETVLPELVYTDARTTYKSVDYPRLTAFLVEVAKAQQTEIEVLRTAVSTTLSIQQSGGQLTYLGGDLNLQNYALLNVKNIIGTNNKWAIDENGQFITRIQTSDGNTKEMFAMQSPYSEFVFSSSSELVNGEAIINFDPDTCELIDETQPLKVNITLTGECGGIFVKEKSATGFVVKELNGGTSTSTFDWMVIAKRKFATTSPQSSPSQGEEGVPSPLEGEGEDEVVTTTPPAEAGPLTEQSFGDGEPTSTPEIPPEPPIEESTTTSEVLPEPPIEESPVEAEPLTEQSSGDGEPTPPVEEPTPPVEEPTP